MVIDGVDYKEVAEYPRYYAGKDGSIYSSVSKKVLSPGIGSTGYLTVSLFDEEHNRHTVQVHRIIAKAWIPNDEDKPLVHHKDEDKTNNSVDNLAWVSAIENSNLGTHNQRTAARLSNSVVLVSVMDGSILKFSSVREARRKGYRVDNILSGKTKTTKGYALAQYKKS